MKIFMKIHLYLLIVVIISLSAQGQDLYRVVQGKIVPRNSRDWTIIHDAIEVTGYMGGALRCTTFTESTVDNGGTVRSLGAPMHIQNLQTKRIYKDTFILTNYPGAGRFQKGDVINRHIAVMRLGGLGTMALYDYGVDYTPPARQLTPAESAAAQAEAAKRNANMDAIKLKFEEEQAENGRDLYQYRMGMRYLKGDGVEKDLTKASEYLRKSAAQGNQDAAKALAKSGTQKPTPPATEGGVR